MESDVFPCERGDHCWRPSMDNGKIMSRGRGEKSRRRTVVTSRAWTLIWIKRREVSHNIDIWSCGVNRVWGCEDSYTYEGEHESGQGECRETEGTGVGNVSELGGRSSGNGAILVVGAAALFNIVDRRHDGSGW
jgi:hypothetical protein